MMETGVEVAHTNGESRRTRRPWLLLTVLLILALAIVFSAIWSGHRRSSLRPFTNYPTYGFSTPVKAGHTEYYGGNVLDARYLTRAHPNRLQLSLHLSRVRPIVAKNTAGADISVLKCVRTNVGSDVAGVDRYHVEAACSKLIPFTSGDVTIGSRRNDDDIVVAVTPRHAGSVRITGLTVRVSSGLRDGSQHVGAEMRSTTN